LIRGDTEVELVVLCGEKPTKSLLDKICKNLPIQLAISAPEDKYEVRMVFEEACLLVSTLDDEGKRLVTFIHVLIYLDNNSPPPLKIFFYKKVGFVF